MPFTPFHLGPGLFFEMIFLKYLDFFAFLLGNVILDIEPFFVVLYNFKYPYRSYPHHAFFHTILGAFLVSVLTAIILDEFQQKIQKAALKHLPSEFEKILSNTSSFPKIFFSVFLGTLLHLLFDSFMHYDVLPFWPFHFNPLLRLISPLQNYLLCIIFGILGIVLFVLNLKKKIP